MKEREGEFVWLSIKGTSFRELFFVEGERLEDLNLDKIDSPGMEKIGKIATRFLLRAAKRAGRLQVEPFSKGPNEE